MSADGGLDFKIRRRLIASYPLSKDGSEASGKQPCKLKDIYFEEEAAAVRGEYMKHDVCTPHFNNLDMGSFGIEVSFHLRSEKRMWVIIGGHGHRWFGVGVENGKIMATLNNQDSSHIFEETKVELHKWYDVAVSCNLEAKVVQVWLDGVPLSPWDLGADFEGTRAMGLHHEQQFMTTNYSNGATFHGLIRSLSIYGAPIPFVRAVTLQVAALEGEEAFTVICLSLGGDPIASLSLEKDAKVSHVRAELMEQGLGKDAVLQFLGVDATVLDEDMQLAGLVVDSAQAPSA